MVVAAYAHMMDPFVKTFLKTFLQLFWGGEKTDTCSGPSDDRWLTPNLTKEDSQDMMIQLSLHL